MRKFLPITILALLLVMIFNVTEVRVTDEHLNVPVTGAKVNGFTTNDDGVVKFLNFSFNEFLHVERIGYEEILVKKSFLPIYYRTEIKLTEGDAKYIKQQILNWANKEEKYRYTLQSISSGSTYMYTQIVDGHNYLTKTVYKKGENSTTEEVCVIGEKVYTKENGILKEITENKEDFLANNLILIPLGNVFSDILSNIESAVTTFESPTRLVFKEENNTVEITLTSSGIPYETKVTLGDTQSILTIDLTNTKVSVNEE